MPESNELLYDVGVVVAFVSIAMTIFGALPVFVGLLAGGIGTAASAYHATFTLLFQPPYVVATVVAVVFIAAEFMPLRRAAGIGTLVVAGVTGLLVEFSPGVTVLYVLIPSLVAAFSRTVAFKVRDRYTGEYVHPADKHRPIERLGDIIGDRIGSAKPATDGGYEAFVCFEHDRTNLNEEEALEHFTEEHDMTEDEVREHMESLREDAPSP